MYCLLRNLELQIPLNASDNFTSDRMKIESGEEPENRLLAFL